MSRLQQAGHIFNKRGAFFKITLSPKAYHDLTFCDLNTEPIILITQSILDLLISCLSTKFLAISFQKIATLSTSSLNAEISLKHFSKNSAPHCFGRETLGLFFGVASKSIFLKHRLQYLLNSFLYLVRH